MATSLNNLAILYGRQGRYAEAEPLYQRSLKIRRSEARARPPRRGRQPEQPGASCTVALGALADAVEAIDRARRTILRHVVRVLPALAEKEQLTFLKANDEGHLHVALSLALVRSDDRATAARSAGWVLNGKAPGAAGAGRARLLARGRKDPAAAKLVTQLRDVRNRLAALTLAIPRPGQEDDRKRELDRLDEQERELSKQARPGHGPARRATTPGSSPTRSARPCPPTPSWSRSPGSTSSTSRPRGPRSPGSRRIMPPG